MSKSQIDEAFSCTDCTADPQALVDLPVLSKEAVDNLLGHFSREAIRSSDYPALRMLMHLHPQTRYEVAASFAPLGVVIAAQAKCVDALRLKSATIDYIRSAILWHMADFSVRRYESRPELPDQPDKLTTLSGASNKKLLCCAPVTVKALALSKGCITEEETMPDEMGHLICNLREDFILERDVCDGLHTALDASLAARWQDEGSVLRSKDGEAGYWARWARFASPYQRALWYEDERTQPVIGASVKIQYYLHGLTIRNDNLTPVWNREGACSKHFEMDVFSAP